MEVVLVFGLLGLSLFLYPAVRSKTVNSGSVTGMFLSMLLIGYSFEAKRINGFLTGSRSGIFVITALAVLALLAMAITIAMIGAWRLKPDPNATLIVLGCKVDGDRPSVILASRLKAARRYLESHPEARCILAGGKGAADNLAEADCMYDYLVKSGIASARLYRENRSTSTRENLVFSQEIISRYHLSQEIAIVTSEFHQYRAGLIARELGFKPTVVIARTPAVYFLTYYIRELYGILLEWINRKR